MTVLLLLLECMRMGRSALCTLQPLSWVGLQISPRASTSWIPLEKKELIVRRAIALKRSLSHKTMECNNYRDNELFENATTRKTVDYLRRIYS